MNKELTQQDIIVYANGSISCKGKEVKNAKISNLGRGYRLFIDNLDVLNVDRIYHTKELVNAIFPYIKDICEKEILVAAEKKNERDILSEIPYFGSLTYYQLLECHLSELQAMAIVNETCVNRHTYKKEDIKNKEKQILELVKFLINESKK